MGVNYTSAGAKKQTGSIFNVVTLSKSITANGGMQLCELYGLYGRICWKISFSPFDLMGEMKVPIRVIRLFQTTIKMYHPVTSKVSAIEKKACNNFCTDYQSLQFILILFSPKTLS